MRRNSVFAMLAAMLLMPFAAQAADDAAEPEKNWKFPGDAAVKFTQSYFSENWYKGGQSNISLLSQFDQEADYAKGNVTVDNKLEAKLGYYTTKTEDDRTMFKVNEDLLRLTSKFGMRAFKDWFYSAQIQGYTQFMNTYADDNVTLESEFFAPVYASASIGMDYKPTFDNDKITLSLLLSPVAYNCRYVKDIELAPRFGIEPGKKFKQDIGSSAELNLKWNFWKMLTWTLKGQMFTSYGYIETNIENTLDITVTKFFGVQLFAHWRFDDSVDRNYDWGYNQLKEFLTLNLTYNW